MSKTIYCEYDESKTIKYSIVNKHKRIRFLHLQNLIDYLDHHFGKGRYQMKFNHSTEN